MTLKGLFALWRTVGARPAALRRRRDRREDLGPAVDPRRAGRRRRGGAVVPVRVRGGARGVGVREPRVPRDERDDRRRHRHRRGDRRRLLRVGAPRLSRRGSGDARGEIRRDQLRPRRVALVRRADRLSDGAPDLLDRPVARDDLRHRRRARHARRLGGDGARDEDVSMGRLHDHRGSRQSRGRRNPDGLRRRHRARLHDRPGAVRPFHARAGLVPRDRRHCRRLRRGAPLPDVADRKHGERR